MAFSEFALVGEILLDLIRLKTFSSYETDSEGKTRELICFLAKNEKRGKGERHTDSSYTPDSHANTGNHAFDCQE